MPWRRLPLPGVALLLAGYCSTAAAIDFRSGPVYGLLDLNVSYGMLYRTDDRNEDIIAIANGGTSAAANIDDGTLNYDKGVVSNMVGCLLYTSDAADDVSTV